MVKTATDEDPEDAVLDTAAGAVALASIAAAPFAPAEAAAGLYVVAGAALGGSVLANAAHERQYQGLSSPLSDSITLPGQEAPAMPTRWTDFIRSLGPPARQTSPSRR